MSEDKLKYSMHIQWSDEDNAYLVNLPEWWRFAQKYFAHGNTYEEAARAGQEYLETLVKMSKDEGDFLPEPAIAKDAAEEVFDNINTLTERASRYMDFNMTPTTNKVVLREFAAKITDELKRLDVSIEENNA